MYNYWEEVKKDVREWMIDTGLELEPLCDEHEKLVNALYIDMYDDVTGYASNSYTCCASVAKTYVTENPDLLVEAFVEFGIDIDRFIAQDWEYFDVIIRCHILWRAIAEVVKEISEEFSDEE